MKQAPKLKILMAAAEIAPFAKVGGLADVIGSLPPALLDLGTDTRLIIPLYGSIDRKKYGLKKLPIELRVKSGRLSLAINLWQAFIPSTEVIVYFVDSPDYFHFDEVYAPGNNSERFLFFSSAVIASLRSLDFIPDIIHCHDFHTALIPDIIKSSEDKEIKKIKTIYTIHNFSHQGQSTPHILHVANLHPDSLESLKIDIKDGDVNFMAQGIMNADLISTVSPSYAKEIKTEAYGAGLERLIKKREADLYGILNGIDVNYYNPETDPELVKNFDSQKISGKTKNKLALEKELGLKRDKELPLVAIVSRLTWQKGLDLLSENFANLACNFVILGAGEKRYEDLLKALENDIPGRFSVNTVFNESLAHRIYAGADIFLMPSRFEPCGLGQMIAMRYGTVPIVRATGGLLDTVNPLVFEREARGFSFENLEIADGFSFKNVESHELYETLENAIDIYFSEPSAWKKLMVNGMKKDFTWQHSAQEYLKLYRKLKD